MRITSNMIHNDVIYSLNNTSALINKYNSQLLGGKIVTRPSDDPISMTSILNSRRALSGMDQYDKNISTVRSHLQTAEGALSQVSDILNRVNMLTIQGSNDTYDAQSRESIAQEIEELRDQIGILSNTKFGSYYVFGGVDTQNAPFDRETGKWAANPAANKKIEIEISEGIFMPINVDGEQLFNGGGLGRNIFELLTDIADNLRAGDTDALADRIEELGDVENQLLKSISTIGSNINRLDLVETKNDEFTLHTKEDLSNKEDVDIQELYIQLTSAKATYQAGIAVSSKILQTSLVDYLR